MGNEGFARVFTPSAKTVEELRDKHRRAATMWFIIALLLLTSLAICLRWILGAPSEVITNPLVARIAMAGVILEGAAVIGAGVAMEYHSIKADYYGRKLNDEYIRFNRWEKTKYYNLQ